MFKSFSFFFENLNLLLLNLIKNIVKIIPQKDKKILEIYIIISGSLVIIMLYKYSVMIGRWNEAIIIGKTANFFKVPSICFFNSSLK
jgi:hypothetical protein